MQLRLSLATATLLASMALQAQDYVSLQYLQYDEGSGRTSVSAPALTINKDFGADYTLNAYIVVDAVSGASPAYSVDTGSGASAFSRGIGVAAATVQYSNISYTDTRTAGDLALTKRLDNRDELNIGIARSQERDFYSSELSTEYMHWLGDNKNKSLSFGVSYQANEILVECTVAGTSSCDTGSGASEKMTASVINTQLTYAQNISQNATASISLFGIMESGYLTNPYKNVVRNNNGVTADVVGENRPDSRKAYGVSLKYANALRSSLTFHTLYRYYTDDWNINSHTLDLSLIYELNKKWTLDFGIRGYMQGEADFYNGSSTYFTSQIYASSDDRLSNFTSSTIKTNVEYTMSKDWSVNFSANYYEQSTDLQALYFMTGIRYNF
ncbi:DUF3570 domain-containing protein [Sulfurimonas sp. SAG-AH-194-I05]|nr:DUF3570 domain-containing protein [Sulfurimonas sp. SAG-AH-194-I05]MDF1875951.1 DUF3570 domain-containing protein [Sulfurimonas sp. SAG-AH-194-I05]